MTNNEKNYDADVAEPLRTIFGDAEPGTLFSEPAHMGDSMVVTASAWERAGGFGFGSGSGSDDLQSGGGGGGSSQGRPVAVIRVSESGVEVQPVVDFTKIGVTFLFAFAGWLSLRKRSG